MLDFATLYFRFFGKGEKKEEFYIFNVNFPSANYLKWCMAYSREIVAYFLIRNGSMYGRLTFNLRLLQTADRSPRLQSRGVNKRMKILIRLVITNVVIAICIGIASLLPGLWTGVGGRDFQPQAFNAAILILATAVMMRYKVKWPILHMILYLIPAQFIVLISMSYFSGYTVFQIFSSFDFFHDFIQWLLLVDLFIGAPWIMGVFIGSLMLRIKDKDKIMS